MWTKWTALGLLAALLLAGCGGGGMPGGGTGTQCTRATVQLNLNTGYDQSAGTIIPGGQLDNEWWVTVDPTPGATVPRQAHVTNLSFPISFPNTKYISINPNGTAYNDPNNPPPNPIIYEYTYYFTLPNGASSPSLNLKLSADDAIEEVRLNGNVLHTFSPSNPGNMLTDSVTISTSNPALFNFGAQINILQVRVRDTFRAITALIVEGSVRYTDCCREPIRTRSGLQSLSFLEGTGAVQTVTFPSGSAQLTTRLTGNLGPANRDFEGVPGEEFYDVFYSDWDGTPNPNGAFITVEATFERQLPFGGGLNIAKVLLNTSSGSLAADSVMSFVGLGDNFLPLSVVNAIDGSNSTDTTMGNTSGQGGKRLRITLGFPCCQP
jgi:hypothetical protein